MADEAGDGGGLGGRRVRPQQHLLQVFPGEPVFEGRPAGKGKGGGGPGHGAGGKQPRLPGRRLAQAFPQDRLRPPHSLLAQETHGRAEPAPRANATVGGPAAFAAGTAVPSLERAWTAWRRQKVAAGPDASVPPRSGGDDSGAPRS
eukprot:scaffold17411_cov113-Isochrysis_galbana.AAC.4